MTTSITIAILLLATSNAVVIAALILVNRLTRAALDVIDDRLMTIEVNVSTLMYRKLGHHTISTAEQEIIQASVDKLSPEEQKIYRGHFPRPSHEEDY